MSKVIKQMQMDDLKNTFGNVRDMVLLNVVGLGAIPDNQLRNGLRKKGIRMQMVKNSLARKVFTELGLEINKGWEGATTVVWGGNSIAELSNELQGLIKKNDKLIKVKGAVADGQEVAFDVALKMPTREQAIANLLGALLGPAQTLVGQLNGPSATLAGQLETLSKKAESGEPSAPSA